MSNPNQFLTFIACLFCFFSCNTEEAVDDLIEDTFVETPAVDIVFDDGDTLDFENVVVGYNRTLSFEIHNEGNVALSVSNISVPSGYSLDWLSGNIQIGEFQVVEILFEPKEEREYQGVVRIESNIDEGSTEFNIDGVGDDDKFEGDANLFTQEELEQFISDGYTEVGGRLILGGEVTSLAPLEKLKTVGGLDVFQTKVESLVGIEDLQINEMLQIALNSSLKTLDGFPTITDASFGINITYNPLISNLEALSNLNSCEYLYITNSENLESIDGVSSLTDVRSNLHIKSNPKIKNLDGLAKLTRVGGSLSISGNDVLTSYCGIKDFLVAEGLEGIFYLPKGNKYNPTRWDIQDVECEKDIPDNVLHGELRFRNQSGIDSYDFSGYDTIDGDLIIISDTDIDVVSSLSNLSSIKVITGDISIKNTLLANLDDLSGLESINALYIKNNANLSDYCSISSIVEAEDIYVSIEDNSYNPTKEELIAAETCSQD
ncbi:hypothetical protein [Reichenbachiella sp.]|uniref:Ig-like domain-containing protein n=1 Tax=Reichenbachiella sp. TaxID=2184521 RepID=UPI003BB104F6